MTPLAQQQITVEKEEVKGMSLPKTTLRTTKKVKLPFYIKMKKTKLKCPINVYFKLLLN